MFSTHRIRWVERSDCSGRLKPTLAIGIGPLPPKTLRRDGTQWELEFEYSNGHKPVRFDGDNSYPYNFDKFQRLFGIDVTEED